MTQNDMILAHLKSGRDLTPLDALRDYGCFRLAARIGELREAGHKIGDRREGSGHSIYFLVGANQLRLTLDG